jgi:phosphatidylglycerophosphate synthase
MLSVRGFFTIVFTPLARRMTGVNPNTLTAVSLVAGVLAGVSFAFTGQWRGAAVAAGVLVTVSGSADALDGIVARLFSRTSRAGSFLDHLADRVVETAILAGISCAPGAAPMLGAAVIVITLLHSYLGAQIEAAFGVRDYGGGGKAEQFVGLVIFAGVLALAPKASLGAAGVRVSLTNLFLIILGVLTTASFLRRLARGLAMARQDESRRREAPDR